MTKAAQRIALEKIARETTGTITTLEARKSDDLDFHSISVWTLEEMLTKAYELGLRDGQKK